MRVGETIDGRFELLALRGEGGMGQVYQARDRSSGLLVALKTTLGSSDERFSREAATLAQLRHPHIVTYLARGADDGAAWIAMEWLDGEDLHERLQRARLDVAASCAIARAVAGALAAAHGQGIVHRDIKPANIFLPGRDPAAAKVLDFGVARVLDGMGGTATGAMIGTLGYMAPEQARGQRDVGPGADLFSLGCVLYECLSGRRAFPGEHAVAVLAKVLLDTPPALADLGAGTVPAALADLVTRLLDKDPARRPSSARAVLDTLDAPFADEAVAPTVAVRDGKGLGRAEQAFVSVVLMTRDARAMDATVALQGELEERREIVSAAARYGASVAELLGGTLVASVTVAGTPRDHARQAARCALAMRVARPGTRLVLCTGRKLEGGMVGEVIDRGAALLRGSDGEHGIRLDETTAALLGDGFDVRLDEDAWLLHRELAPGSAVARRPCFGRERELATLGALLDECLDEPSARAALVVGAPGLGKSCLLAEALSRAAAGNANDAEVWRADADPLAALSPFGLLARLVRAAAGLSGGESAAVKRERLQELAARHVPRSVERVSGALFTLCGVSPADPTLAGDAAPGDRGGVAESLRRAWEDLATGAVKSRPLLVVIEDLQWADLPSVRALDATLRRLQIAGASGPLFVLATGRPEVTTTFPELWAGRGMQELRLGELGHKAALRLVQARVGPSVDATTLQEILAHGAGNAFFLEELARAAAEGRNAPIPETVVGMVEARLRGLDAEDRRLLRAASVLGQQFLIEGVEALSGAASAEGDDAQASSVRARIEGLVEREILRPDDGSASRFAFAHALVREAAYGMLTAEDRRLGHGLAAAWLERTGETDVLVLAHHFERSSEPTRARGCYESAARDALAVGDADAAVDFAERALDRGAEGEELGRLLALSGEALLFRGDLDRARERAIGALALLPKGSPAWLRASLVTTGSGFSRFARSFS